MESIERQLIAYMAAMKDNGITELNLDMGKLKIALKRETSVSPGALAEPRPPFSEHVAPSPGLGGASQHHSQPAPSAETTLTSVHSPLVGTYYQAADPQSEPFVRTGQDVAAGDVLCIIEAMKSMNEIKAPVAGVVAEILGVNGGLVEHGQLLFRLRPRSGA